MVLLITLYWEGPATISVTKYRGVCKSRVILNGHAFGTIQVWTTAKSTIQGVQYVVYTAPGTLKKVDIVSNFNVQKCQYTDLQVTWQPMNIWNFYLTNEKGEWLHNHFMEYHHIRVFYQKTKEYKGRKQSRHRVTVAFVMHATGIVKQNQSWCQLKVIHLKILTMRLLMMTVWNMIVNWLSLSSKYKETKGIVLHQS